MAVELFGTAHPASLDGVSGAVTVSDPALLASLRADPGVFYVNLDTAAFPKGALRGQLAAVHPAGVPVDGRGVRHPDA